MKIIFRKLAVAHLLIVSICSSCNEVDSPSQLDCVRGKFVGYYCEGIVIKILDNNDIGTDWIGMFDSKTYENSVVASIDSLLTKNLSNHSSLFPADSIFYFDYKHGGYPRIQYNICDPSAYITITNISETCTNSENE